jgi:hypothetical protein
MLINNSVNTRAVAASTRSRAEVYVNNAIHASAVGLSGCGQEAGTIHHAPHFLCIDRSPLIILMFTSDLAELATEPLALAS